MRTAESPFSNPFSTSQRFGTGESQVAAAAPSDDQPTEMAAIPTPSVQSEPLPPVSAAPARAMAAAPVAAPAISNQPVTSSSGGWSAAGGTRITVTSNDSLPAISQRYGVPANAILSANGLSAAAQIQPGSNIVIPIYNAAGQGAPAVTAPTRVAAAPMPSAPARVAAAPAPVAPVRTAAAPAAPAPAAVTSSTKFRFVEGPKPVPRPVADEAEKTAKARVRPGMVTAAQKTEAAKAAPVQTAKAAPAAPAPAPAPVVAAKAAPAPVVAAKPAPAPVVQQAAAPKAPEPIKVAKVEPAPVKTVAPAPAPVAMTAPAAPAPTATAYAAPEPAKPAPKEPEQTASLPQAPSADFRWPARGRVIAGFGANGGNEGINIAVPEGTPVKATEEGTVSYAGSEVKGYGNLVLIKHDNGYVSAYAHNGELNVKRGERVKRGQVIAKSGQTGNVTSPQLHFELRKGQSPVDPMSHLN